MRVLFLVQFSCFILFFFLVVIRYVIHHSLPKSLTNYYQESGRAGRDGKKAECVLYFSMNDKQKLLNMIEKSAEERKANVTSAYSGVDSLKQSIDNVNRCVAFCMNQVDCRRVLLLAYFGESFPKEQCHATCDNCRRPQDGIRKVDMTDHGITLIHIVEAIVQRYGDSKLTAIKLSKLYARSKDKECKILEPCIENVRGDKSKTLPLDLGKCLIQEMVLKGYLTEKSSATFSGFSASYISVGPKANELLYNDAVIEVNVNERKRAKRTPSTTRRSVDEADAVDLVNLSADSFFDDVENDPSPPQAVPAKSNTTKSKVATTKKKKNIYSSIHTGLDSDDSRGNPTKIFDDDSDIENSSHLNRFNRLPNNVVDNKENGVKVNSKRFRSPDKTGFSPSSDGDRVDHAVSYANQSISPLYMDDADAQREQQQQQQQRRSLKRSSDEISEISKEGETVRNPPNVAYYPVRTSLLSPSMKRAFTTWMEAYKRRYVKYWQVFGTDTIPEIVKLVPVTIQEITKIAGMGEVRANTYGEHMLATIYAFLEKNDLLHLFPHAQPPSIAPSTDWMDPVAHWMEKDNEDSGVSRGGEDSGSRNVTVRNSHFPQLQQQQRTEDSQVFSQNYIFEPHSGFSQPSTVPKRTSEGIVAQNNNSKTPVKSPSTRAITNDDDDYCFEDDDNNPNNFLV